MAQEDFIKKKTLEMFHLFDIPNSLEQSRSSEAENRSASREIPHLL
jgi:hypothetical protein